MKTKQEQIEEMTKLIQAEYKQWLDVTGVIPEGTTYYAECFGCAIDSAETLYNAGYRKTFTRDTQKAFKEGYKKGCETCAQAWANGYNYGYKSGKEDGVKEFAEELKAKTMCITEYENDKTTKREQTDEITKERNEIKDIMKLLDKCVSLNPMCKSEVASVLYGNNYRKLPKDSIVLSREEYEMLKRR